jgi:hypothetical protein
VLRRPRRPEPGHSRLSGVASNPADLLRRLRTRSAAAMPASGMPAAFAGALRDNRGRTAASAPDTPKGAGAAARAAALLRAAAAGARALAEADAELVRERAETAAGLRAEAPAPARAGMVEVLPNGTRLHHCRTCGRLAAWGFGVALDRGRDGRWFCFEHRRCAE